LRPVLAERREGHRQRGEYGGKYHSEKIAISHGHKHIIRFRDEPSQNCPIQDDPEADIDSNTR
jgi:hypothetical protein